MRLLNQSRVVGDGRGTAVDRGKAISNVAVSKGRGKGKAGEGTARQREADHPLAKWCGSNHLLSSLVEQWFFSDCFLGPVLLFFNQWM